MKLLCYGLLSIGLLAPLCADEFAELDVTTEAIEKEADESAELDATSEAAEESIQLTEQEDQAFKAFSEEMKEEFVRFDYNVKEIIARHKDILKVVCDKTGNSYFNVQLAFDLKNEIAKSESEDTVAEMKESNQEMSTEEQA